MDRVLGKILDALIVKHVSADNIKINHLNITDNAETLVESS